MAQRQDWASTFPLFHWGLIPWGFYILPACAYAYMFFVKKRKRQTLSEACRPILKKRTDEQGRQMDRYFCDCWVIGRDSNDLLFNDTFAFRMALAHVFTVSKIVNF